MSAEESHGSHSLTSFAASRDCSIPQPQLKQMAPRRKLTDTAKDLPPELYEKLKTPERETSDDRKKRVQRITREWAKRWVAYEWLNPQHEEMFAVNPPLKTLGIKARPPPAPGVIPHPTTLRRPEDFPEAYQLYLKRSGSRVKSLVRDLTASVQLPTQPQPQHRKKTPGIKPSKKSSASLPISESSCQRTAGAAPSSRLRTDESRPAPEASTTMPQPPLKTKAVIQRGPHPSPKKTAMRGALPHTPQTSDDEDEFEDLAAFVATEEDKVEYVHAAARRKAKATGSEIPLLLDPKKILEYIEIWSVKPDTPLDDLDIPKDIKFYVQQFLINEIHQRDLQKQLKAKLKKVLSDFKKKPITEVTPKEFIEHQCEVQCLNTEFAANRAYIGKSKERMSQHMSKLMKLHQPASSTQAKGLKRLPETQPSTLPPAKKPSVEEPIDAPPISSAPPASKVAETQPLITAASTPPPVPQRSLIVFTPPTIATPLVPSPTTPIVPPPQSPPPPIITEVEYMDVDIMDHGTPRVYADDFGLTNSPTHTIFSPEPHSPTVTEVLPDTSRQSEESVGASPSASDANPEAISAPTNSAVDTDAAAST